MGCAPCFFAALPPPSFFFFNVHVEGHHSCGSFFFFYFRLPLLLTARRFAREERRKRECTVKIGEKKKQKIIDLAKVGNTVWFKWLFCYSLELLFHAQASVN